METYGKVLFRVAGGPWTPPSTSGYESESALQRLLAAQPGLLPGVDDGARAVVEFSTQVGPSDVVVVEPDGDITLVECKLASNEEARRKIVGQVLDYAARLWKMPVTEFEARWVQRSGEPFASWLEPGGLERLGAALAEGRFRLILAVDIISADLRRLVEFLNAHTSDSLQVLAIELHIAHAGDVDVLVPSVYGAELAESATRPRAAGSARSWTVEDVTDWFAQHRPDVAGPVEEFLRRLRAAGCVVIGTAAQSPSLVVALDGPAGTVWPYALYTGEKPALNLNVEYLLKAGVEAQERFTAAMSRAVPAFPTTQVRAANYRRRPGVDPAVLAAEQTLAQLVRAVEDLRAGWPTYP